MNVAIIPARGGSKRNPRKNIRDFCGKPMIAWPIEAARNSAIFDRILVSTDDAEIREFCSTTYGVTFPMFAKVDVNGPAAHPLWVHLKQERPGLLGTEAIKWNFTKFLVGRDGVVVKRYGPQVEPKAIAADIAALL